MVEAIRALADERADLFAIELLIGELISNVARYTPGPFCSELTWNPDGVAQIVFHDAGDCFLSIDRQMPDPDEHVQSGRGIALLRTLGAKLRIESNTDAGCIVRIAVPARLRDDAVREPDACPEGPSEERNGRCSRPVRAVRTSSAR